MNRDALDHHIFSESHLVCFRRFKFLIPLFILVICTTRLFGDDAQPSEVATKDANNYGIVRTEVLNSIGGAKKRIWISTNFLTDGEIVSALFLAKYRRIDTKIMVENSKVNHYMSRVSDLKRNNVPVFLMPARFAYAKNTYILADDKGYFINADLNHTQTRAAYTITSMSLKESAEFASSFEKALSGSGTVVVKPLPLVGKPGGRGRGHAYRPSAVSRRPNDGSYNYDTMSAVGSYKIPQGVNKRLPKDTIYQKKQRQTVQEQLSKPAATDTNMPPKGPKDDRVQDDSRRDNASPPTSME